MFTTLFWFGRRPLIIGIIFSLFLGLLPLEVLAQNLNEVKQLPDLRPGGGLEELREPQELKEQIGFAAVLVDEETWNAELESSGGLFGFFGSGALSQKIQRYATDVQKALPQTKVGIIKINANHEPGDIRRILEKLYFEGEDKTSEFNRLSGLVLVGNVPLPVIEINGERQPSLVPYTDFLSPRYVWDAGTENFVSAEEGLEFQNEIWHGVISPPVGGQEGFELLGQYFDKNHAFHSGDELYADFEKKLFIADFEKESSVLNDVSFGTYQRFLEMWEDMVYYRYTNDLLEELYVQLTSEVTPGDSLDNDSDEKVDEEAANGVDDDGDGLVDEDLGDGFMGIDNDQDGEIDEDGAGDNNNDRDWYIPLRIGEGGENYFEDRMTDEDPPGDANGDGCPGVCGQDYNGYASDSDQDGYPDGWEIFHGFNPLDARKPYKRVSKYLNSSDEYGRTFDSDEAATAFLEEQFTGDNYSRFYQDRTCFDASGNYHPEWDDDQDFFCDEDGGPDNEVVWLVPGVPDVSGCLSNDADCDGLIDEDTQGFVSENRFDLLPDIQSKPFIEQFMNRYMEIFDQAQGLWNGGALSTGRFALEELDTPVSLIAKKDEYALLFLKAVNDLWEFETDEIIKSEKAENIPLVALMEIKGDISVNEEDPEEFCTPGLQPELDSACPQFVNHSTNKPNKSFASHQSEGLTNDIHVYGSELWEIFQVGSCGLYAGTDEEGGQMTELNHLYGRLNSVYSKSETRDRVNCTPENVSLREDIPEICAPELATEPVRDIGGSKNISGSSSGLEVGFPACYEFRELVDFEKFSKENKGFNDWLTGKIRRFRKEGDPSEDLEETYEEFLLTVEDKLDDDTGAYAEAGDLPLRKAYDDIDLLSDDTSRKYTLVDMLSDLGWSQDEITADAIDIFVALRSDDSPVKITNPSFGENMEDVSELNIYFDKLYLKKGSIEDVFDDIGEFTQDEEEAETLSSVHRHVMPTYGTLNIQAKESSTPNIPIDKTRRVSFLNKAGEKEEIVYLNVFDADSLSDIQKQIEALTEVLPEAENFLDLINEDQLADALNWAAMNIDEKHASILTHYLGAEEAIFAKARKGYELVSMYSDGTPSSLRFAFNAAAPSLEGDLDWMQDGADVMDEEEDEASAALNVTPVPLFEWLQEMEEWVGEFKTDITTIGFTDDNLYCGGDMIFNKHKEKSGQEGFKNTKFLNISSESESILAASGRGSYLLTVNAEDESGALNREDFATRVRLNILSGAESVEILGSDELTLTEGMAHFLLSSLSPGEFSVSAEFVETGIDSNVLNGSVEDKYLKITSYKQETGFGSVVLKEGKRLEVLDEDGVLAAAFDPETGAISLEKGVKAVWNYGISDEPTGVFIMKEEIKLAEFFIIPELKRVSIGSGKEGVFVNPIEGEAEFDGEDVILFENGERIGTVNSLGQIFLNEGFSLAFANPQQPNLFDEMRILNSEREILFEVLVKHDFNKVDILSLLIPKAEAQEFFSDVSESHPGYEAIMFLADLGILSGYADGTFKPESSLRREDFIKVDLGAICVPCMEFSSEKKNEVLDIYSEAPFPDKDINPELLYCVADAKNRGLISGYAGGEDAGFFVPTRNISRAEAIKILIETAGLAHESPLFGEAWYAGYVRAAQGEDLLPVAEFADSEPGDAEFKNWLESSMKRWEFAFMAEKILRLNLCYVDNPIYENGEDDTLLPNEDFEEPNEVISDFDHDAGLFIVSENVQYEEIAESLEGSGKIKIYTKKTKVIEPSPFFVRAELRDQSGEIYVDDSQSIVEFTLSTEEHGVLASKKVQLKNGVAESEFLSAKVSGDLNVTAILVNAAVAGSAHPIQVLAGEPVRIALSASSKVLPAGGEASMSMRATLYDALGNIADNGFHEITLEIDGGMTFLNLIDENADLDGMQVSVLGGAFDFEVLSSLEVETASISASMKDEIENAELYSIQNRDDLQIILESDKEFLVVGNADPANISVSVTDEFGRSISGFNEEIEFKVQSPLFGSFENTKVMLSEGSGEAVLIPGNLAGNGIISAGTRGLEAGSLSLNSLPGESVKLSMRKKDGAKFLRAGEVGEFIIEAYDEFGNLNVGDNETNGSIKVTEATSDYGTLFENEFILENGSAEIQLQAAHVSGIVNLSASAQNLESAHWGGEIEFEMGPEYFRELEPQMLVGSLFGAAYGDITKDDYLGGWMTFNGKTQALITQIYESRKEALRASVDASGSIVIDGEGRITQSISSAGAKLPTLIQWRSFPEDLVVADMFVVLDESEEAFEYELVENIGVNVEEKNGALLLRENGTLAAKIRNDGQTVIFDPSYQMSVNAEEKGLNIIISKNATQIVSVEIMSESVNDVSILDSDFDLQNWKTLDAGVHLRPAKSEEKNFQSTFSGSGTHEAKGLALYFEEEAIDLDKKVQELPRGFEKDDKHLLLLAAGNSIGNAHKFYASESDILLGDPSVKLSDNSEINAAGFTQDMGTLIAAGNEDVQHLIGMDWNGDDKKDLLMSYADGRIDVMQNTNSPEDFIDLGTVLMVENGIIDIGQGDFDGDGLEDLVIATEKPCLGEKQCLTLYKNKGATFVAETLEFPNLKKIKTVEGADLNGDEYIDLVLLDEDLKLSIVWNNEAEFEEPLTLEHFGATVNPDANLSSEVKIHLESFSEGTLSLPISVTSSQEVSEGIKSDFASNADVEVTVDGNAESGSFVSRESVWFKPASSEALSGNLDVKKSLRASGRFLSLDDAIDATIELENTSSQVLQNIYVSDLLPVFFEFQEDSFECVNCENSNANAEQSFGPSEHPWIFGPLNLNVGESVEIKYSMLLSELPNMSIMLGQDLHDDYLDDDFMDIAISPEGNQTGRLVLFYSDSYTRDGIKKVSYRRKEYSPESNSEYEEKAKINNPFAFEDKDENGLADFIESIDSDRGIPVSDSGYDPMSELLGAQDADGDSYYSSSELFSSPDDSDGDGLNDIMDDWQNSGDILLDVTFDLSDLSLDIGAELEFFEEEVDYVSNMIENVVTKFTCGGGCLAIPGSVAALAPGLWHSPLTGIPIGFDPGSPVFGIIMAGIPCTGPACYASLVMRMYVAPTTTLGLGLGFCWGPYGLGQCMAYSVPVLQSTGICDAINGFVVDAISKATSFDVSGNSKILNVSASSGLPDSGGLALSAFDSYSPPLSKSSNIQVPGFPSIFTEWWKAQKFEFHKMLDLPDLTFIVPSAETLSSGFKNTEDEWLELGDGLANMDQFINLIHSLPLVNIEPKTVIINYPWLTQEEIDLMKRDAEQWLIDTKAEWERFKEQFNVAALTRELDEETFLELQSVIEGALTDVEANIAILESYKEIPEQILILRDIQTYYAKIIICYLDAILQFTAGYIVENYQRIQAWAQWAIDLQGIVRGWQALFQLSIDLMDSCDKCTNQRWSVFQILLNLFVFIPEFPVVEFPKLPDIVLDVSNIQAGVDIVWPNIKFAPQSISFPELPRIALPSVDLDPNFNFDLKIPLLPEFPINLDLPPLPGLPLPNLPDLPPPPALPDLYPSIEAALNIASDILRVVCLIRSGFIPVPELALKQQIENMTERPAGFVLPIDLAITVKWPSFSLDFLKQIHVITTVNFTADINQLYDVVDSFAQLTNAFTTNIPQEIDRVMQEFANAIESVTMAAGEINLEGELDVDVDVDLDLEEDPQASVPELWDNPLVKSQIPHLTSAMLALQENIDAWAQDLPDDILLTAEQSILSEDDPILHRYEEILSENTEFDPSNAVLGMRNSLIAQVDEIEREMNLLQSDDPNAYKKFLAMHGEPSNFALAANSEQSMGFTETPTYIEQLRDMTDDMKVELSAESTDNLDSYISAFAPVAVNNGLYILEPESGVGMPLISYAKEADAKVNTLFIDKDMDGDEDIVYTLGGEIYIKENHKKQARKEYFAGDPEVYEASDISSDGFAISRFEATENKYQKVNFSYEQIEDALAYEMLVYDSPISAHQLSDENLYRLLFMEESGNNSTLSVKSINGSMSLYNARQRTLIKQNGELKTNRAVTFAALKDSVIEVFSSEGDKTSVEVPATSIVEFGAGEGEKYRIENGEVLWLKEKVIEEAQNVFEGSPILPGELLVLNSSGAEAVLDLEGQEILLDNKESFVMDILLNGASPSGSLEVLDGAYTARIRALTESGFTSFSQSTLFNPQICADDSAPKARINFGSEMDLAIYSSETLSAKDSFDIDGSISEITWDADILFDADADGDATNDIDGSGMEFIVGPYGEVGDRNLRLNISDMAGNKSFSDIQVHVLVPEIIITESNELEVKGKTLPATENLPLQIVRERNGVSQVLGETIYTDSAGEFSMDFDDSDNLFVLDGFGEKIAEYNPATRQWITLDANYEINAFAKSSDFPTRLSLNKKNTSTVLARLLLPANNDLPVLFSESPLNKENLQFLSRLAVHIYDEEKMEVIDGDIWLRDDFGALALRLGQDAEVEIFNSNFTLKKRAASSLDEFLILEIYENEELLLEFWPGGPASLEIEKAETFGLGAELLSPAYNSNEGLDFVDIGPSHPLYEDINDLVQRGILEGEIVGEGAEAENYFYPNRLISRAEFTKIVLGILCLVPGPEAYEKPTVFSDISNTEDWFYPITKEAFSLGLVTGYLGEKKVGGKFPFKAMASITRAEAVKILLEALETQGRLSLPADLEGRYWYTPYIDIALNLDTPLLTNEEAALPENPITRIEFVEMALRVLDMYSCFDEDTDSDGLGDFDEIKIHGSDPMIADTDGGGVGDGVEVARGSDPLNPQDDQPQVEALEGLLQTIAGPVFLEETCMACPCPASAQEAADLIDGDEVFAILKNQEGLILKKSYAQ